MKRLVCRLLYGFQNGLVTIVTILLLSLTFSKICTGTASFFGYFPLYCMSESMEPVINKGDWVLGKAVGEQELEEGKIYTYSSGFLQIMHRLNNITENGDCIFWGDNNPEPDPMVKPSQVIYEVVLYRNKGKEGDRGDVQ